MSLFSFLTGKKWDNLGVVYTHEQIAAILKNAGVIGDISLRDTEYRCIPTKDFQELVADYCFFGDIPYRKKVFECEDFVYRMWSSIVVGWAKVTKTEKALALACGYMDGVNMRGNRHAWFWYINDKGIPIYYESQTGRYMDMPPLMQDNAEA